MHFHGGAFVSGLITADDDPLRDETLAYARRLDEARVPVSAFVLPAPTDWPGALQDAAGAGRPWVEEVGRRIAAFLATAGRREAVDAVEQFSPQKRC